RLPIAKHVCHGRPRTWQTGKLVNNGYGCFRLMRAPALSHTIRQATKHGALGLGLPGAGGKDAPEADVRSTRVRRRPAAGAGAITLAVRDIAQKGAALDDAPRRITIDRIEALAWTGRVDAAVEASALLMQVRAVPVATPLPDIAGHVVETIAVGREAVDGRRAGIAVLGGVLDRELSLVGVGHVLAAGLKFVPPG